MSSFVLHDTKKPSLNWNRFRATYKQRATRRDKGWSTWPGRRGWEGWPCSAWRTDGFGVSEQKPTSTYREVKVRRGKWSQDSQMAHGGRTRDNGYKLKWEVQIGCKKIYINKKEPPTHTPFPPLGQSGSGTRCPVRLCSHSPSLEIFPVPTLSNLVWSQGLPALC